MGELGLPDNGGLSNTKTGYEAAGIDGAEVAVNTTSHEDCYSQHPEQAEEASIHDAADAVANGKGTLFLWASGGGAPSAKVGESGQGVIHASHGGQPGHLIFSRGSGEMKRREGRMGKGLVLTARPRRRILSGPWLTHWP